MTVSTTTSRQDFWLSHRRRAKDQGLSLRAYAQREGISLASLYATRPAVPHHASRPSGHAGFAAVHVAGIAGCQLSLPGGVSLRLPEAPSGSWLAALLRELAP